MIMVKKKILVHRSHLSLNLNKFMTVCLYQKQQCVGVVEIAQRVFIGGIGYSLCKKLRHLTSDYLICFQYFSFTDFAIHRKFALRVAIPQRSLLAPDLFW
ncbi:hypothetical protein C5167_008680 [Papaver somniferum]|uniref:Uncharacterized protein n=1 Tax=Papaver somniferum TaxID=3469 RepID=A0A4Y7JYY4_PAPSO|nr:hypothetical protein C5167_008680 [Papaver somniferum]